MAANEKLSVKFEAVGAKGLQNAINGIRIATLGLTQSQKQYAAAVAALSAPQKQAVAGMFAIQTATRNTGNAFSVLRSKMLLVSFGFLVVGQSVGRLVAAASDLEEMMSKANVVFGENMAVVGMWAESLGSRVGRATSQIITMASTLQDTFVPLGFTREAATQLSTTMTKLAIDVASFNNQQDANVVRDFQSAIVGNHETVRKYGIIITESRLKLEAMTLGLIKGNQQLTAQQKVQARLSLITKGSADAIGDAERTSGSFQNQMKALNAELLESAEFFGQAVINILQFDLAVGDATFSLVDFVKHLAKKETIMGYAAAIFLVGANFVIMRIKATKLTFSLQALNKAMLMTTGGALAFVGIIGTLAGFIIQAITKQDEQNKSLEETEKRMADTAFAAGLLTEGEEGFTESVSKNVAKLEKKLNTLKAVTLLEKEQAKVTHELTDLEKQYIAEIQQETINQENLKKVKSAIASINKKDLSFQIAEQKRINDTHEAYVEDLQHRINLMEMELILNNENLTTQEKTNELINKNINEGYEKVFGNIKNMTISQQNLNESILDMAENLGFSLDIVTDTSTQTFIDALKIKLEEAELAAPELIKKLEELQEKLRDQSPYNRFAEGFSSAIQSISQEADMYSDILTSLSETAKAVELDQENACGNFAQTVGGAFVQAGQMAVQANIDFLKAQAQVEIDSLKQSKRFNRLSRRQQEAELKEIKENRNNEIKAEFKNQKALNKADATMNFAAAVMKISKQTGVLRTPFIAALAVLYGKQLDLINSQKAPVMEYGGLIGGKSHSQGGTMIEAEKGEFVVRKSAVEALGIETMNRINTGEGVGGINITFQGNVMSNDFIEEEAIPQIREAIRRGADIGIG